MMLICLLFNGSARYEARALGGVRGEEVKRLSDKPVGCQGVHGVVLFNKVFKIISKT